MTRLKPGSTGEHYLRKSGQSASSSCEISVLMAAQRRETRAQTLCIPAFGLRDLAHAFEPRIVMKAVLVDVGDVHNRLLGEQVQVADQRAFLRIELQSAHRLRLVELIAHALEDVAE